MKGCTNKPNTIVTQITEDVPIAGLCEEHFQRANVPGGAELDFVWDDFDAFKQTGDDEETQ